jgi:hypothetical protein
LTGSLGNVLNVAIGLVLTFLILGLLATTVHEAIASLFRSRARLLRHGLQQLLSNGAPTSPLFQKVYGHALVQSLSARGLPSYVPADSFAMALFDSLSDGGAGARIDQIERGIRAMPEGPTKQSLMTFIVESGGSHEALRRHVKAWFDDAMDRLSGIYKRRSQGIHLAFGLVVAMGFNVDSIHIAEVLWQNPGKQQAIMTIAQNVAAGTQASADEAATVALDQLARLPVPMGWGTFVAPRSAVSWLDPLAGWLLTGFAVSLGAPFWFDLLQKVMAINLRGTGPKPDDTN